MLFLKYRNCIFKIYSAMKMREMIDINWYESLPKSLNIKTEKVVPCRYQVTRLRVERRRVSLLNLSDYKYNYFEIRKCLKRCSGTRQYWKTSSKGRKFKPDEAGRSCVEHVCRWFPFRRLHLAQSSQLSALFISVFLLVVFLLFIPKQLSKSFKSSFR